MPERITAEQRSQIMRAVRSHDSGIETAFRKSLWRLGFRYSRNAREYFGTPDIVLKRYRTVIFVDSCFWHGCSEHFRMPSSRQDYWRAKIDRNKRRDMQVNEHYQNSDWTVFRVWEHDLVRDLESTARHTAKLVRRQGVSSTQD